MKYILIMLLFGSCSDLMIDRVDVTCLECYYHISGSKIKIDSASTDGMAYRLSSGDWIAKHDSLAYMYFDCNYINYTIPCK